jgi:molecular chaperone DnaK
MAGDNKTLGKFILDGIPPAPRGVPQVEVTFDIDANGILNVSAQDKATGRTQHITITASSGLSEQEVDRMVKEAERNRSADERRKGEIEQLNTADQAIYTAEKAIRDFGGKMDSGLKSSIEKQIDAVRKAKDSKDLNKVKSAVEELQRSIQQIGAAMYEQPGAAGSGSSASGDGAKGEDVIEGEVVE